MAELTQHMDMTYKQACIDLEKATQLITQVLQHEVARNRELCVLIRRLEEREVETGRSLAEQGESNRLLQLKIDELQKHLEGKDNSLTQANQTVAALRNELGDLHQRFQRQQTKNRTFQEGNEWLQGGENQLKVETPLEASVSEIKRDESTGDDYGECRQPVENTDLRTEHVISSATDIKTELIQEEEVMSGVSPVISSGGALSDPTPTLTPTDPLTLARLSGVSVELVDCCRTQGQTGTDRENRRDGERLENHRRITVNRTGSSISPSTPPGSEIPSFLWTQPTVASSSPSSPELEDSGMFSYPHADDGSSNGLMGDLLAGDPHHATPQSSDRPYHCLQCGKRFTRENILRQHLCRHGGTRRYHCNLCGKSFAHVGNLKVHQRTHTGERLYPCTRCGKSFTHEGKLRTHERIHTGERPYQCALCGKSFTQKGNLKTHQRTHTGERRYRCHQCGQGFHREYNFKLHLHVHAAETSYHSHQTGKS